ncbi:MAG: MoaD/ThiS family protein [Candidatus Tectomicrobia bacterium]|nr:MoaD/ThiS family protein [Candidatus Tectomicrobia bacterium]
MAVVWIPSLMRNLTAGAEKVSVQGSTLREVIDNLDALYPGFKEQVCDEGRINPYLAVAVDGEVTTEGLRQRVSETSEIHFLPAISGG